MKSGLGRWREKLSDERQSQVISMSFCCQGISTILRARLFNQIEVVGESLRRRTRLLRRRIIGSYGIFPKAVLVMTGTNGTSGNNDNGHSVPQPRAEWIARRKAEN